MTRSPALLFQDKTSFREPLRNERAKALKALTEFSGSVEGSEARMHRALSKYEALRSFDMRVANCLRDASFRSLPLLRDRWTVLSGFHRLDSGPYRAIFLLGADPTLIVGLLFSCEPHDATDLVKKLAEPYLKGGRVSGAE